MKQFKPDHQRRLELPGVPNPVQRPVDIDQSQTGFTSLRTLRIYRFEPEVVIEGHAEEDEVFIVVLAGSIELTMSEGDSKSSAVTLTAAASPGGSACAAYLPPHSAYQLIPRGGEADIAYARAKPAGGRPAKAFNRDAAMASAKVMVLLDETTYAERLRLRLVQINGGEDDSVFAPIRESESMCEALVHIRSLTPGSVAAMTGTDSIRVPLESWDCVSIAPLESPTLRVVKGASAFVLIVLAA